MTTSQYPKELLRKKLVVAGIPESEHSMEALAARIPADFKVQSLQDMSADMMAELLLYFIAKGIVRLPAQGERALIGSP